MQIHDLQQGSDAWHQFRLEHYGASEAAAMLGLSKKVKRTELLHAKKTGTAKEFSAWVQEHILDHGHHVEALMRPNIEAIIGEDLYPVTCSDGKLSASCDGLTMDERIAFEHKQWNEALAAEVQEGRLPEEHMPQCQQVLMVTGAEVVIFVVSDGTTDKRCRIDVLPDPAWFERIRAGWSQFEKDLAAYEPPEPVEPVREGKAPETLPALHIEVTGAVTASNLAAFKATALTAIRAVNRTLKTDEDFNDAAEAVKWCSDVESRLAAAKEHALSQTTSIDALFKTIDDISAEARTVRLELDKLVTRRKVEIKDAIVLTAKQAYEAHVVSLKAETDGIWTTLVQPDFAGAAKNKRSLTSLQDAVDTELANAKIAADASARSIREKLSTFKADAAEFEFLFADKATLIGKAIDDLRLAIKARIDAHKEAEAEKDRVKQAASAPAPAVIPAKTIEAPLYAPLRVVAASPAQPAASNEPATLKLGTICERLGFTLTAAFVSESLGIQHTATDKAAKLYRESDWPRICSALVEHIGTVAELQAA